MDRKASKILKEAVHVAKERDLSRAMGYVLDEIALGEHSAVEIAAAFVQMKLGDEIEDIRPEKFSFERRSSNRARGRDSRNDGKSSSRDRNDGKSSGRDRYDGKNGGRDKHNGRNVGLDKADRRSGRRNDRGEHRSESKNSHYAALRIKTKKHG